MEVVYTVRGMSCAHCELSVKEQVEELSGVESAQPDHSTGRLTVRGEQVDDALVRQAVEAAGYEVAA